MQEKHSFLAQLNGWPLFCCELEWCNSTNDEALNLLNTYPAVAVWTTDQRSGRGSRGRSWTSPKNTSLAFSLAFNQKVAPPPNQWLYPLFAGVIWYESLQKTGITSGLSLKWPNDLHLNGRKLAGILCESRWRKKNVHTVLGIGTNINKHQKLQSLEKGYAYLLEDLGSVTIAELVSNAIHSFNQGFETYANQDYLRHTWLQRAWIHPATPVLVQAEHQNFSGYFEGLTPEGSLVIRTHSGAMRQISPTCTDFHLQTIDPGA